MIKCIHRELIQNAANPARRIGYRFDRLNDVRMRTDHQIGPPAMAPGGQVALPAIRQRLVLVAPMQKQHHVRRPVAARAGDILPDTERIDPVHRITARDGQSVGPVSIIQQCHPKIPFPQPKRVAGRIGKRIGEYPGILQAGLHERIERRTDSGPAAVADMVVRRDGHVDTDPAHRPGQRAGRAKLRIPRIGFPAERGFQIGNYEVGRSEIIFQPRKTGGVVDSAVSSEGGLHLRKVLHQVSGKDQRQLSVILSRNGNARRDATAACTAQQKTSR